MGDHRSIIKLFSTKARAINYGFLSRIFLIIIIALLFFYIFSSFVPFAADEFIPYHVLACHYYPLNLLNDFWQSCNCYDLAILTEHYLPIRSFEYMGSLPSILYYPLFKLWPSPYSARLLGLFLLAIQAFLIYKLFKVDVLVSFILLIACLPYVFQHLVDTGGPLSLHTTSIFLICYLTQNWKSALQNNLKHSWRFPFLIGIIIFCGIWIKPIYFLIIPGIFILMAYYMFAEGATITGSSYALIKKFIRQTIVLFLTAAIPTIILLNATNRDHKKYLEIIFNWGSMRLLDLKEVLSHLLALSKYLFNPLLTSHEIFEVESKITVSGIILAVTVATFILSGIWSLRRTKEKYSFVIINILLFFLTFFLVAGCRKSWAMHHVLLGFPFVLLALFFIYFKLFQKRFIQILLVILIALSVNLYFSLSRLQPQKFYTLSMPRLNNLLNTQYADKYAFIIIDFGMYHTKALYGDRDQCVLYMKRFRKGKEKQVKQIREILNKTGRKAMFIGLEDSSSDLIFIKESFPDIIPLGIDFEIGKWRIWYEP